MPVYGTGFPVTVFGADFWYVCHWHYVGLPHSRQGVVTEHLCSPRMVAEIKEGKNYWSPVYVTLCLSATLSESGYSG